MLILDLRSLIAMKRQSSVQGVEGAGIICSMHLPCGMVRQGCHALEQVYFIFGVVSSGGTLKKARFRVARRFPNRYNSR